MFGFQRILSLARLFIPSLSPLHSHTLALTCPHPLLLLSRLRHSASQSIHCIGTWWWCYDCVLVRFCGVAERGPQNPPSDSFGEPRMTLILKYYLAPSFLPLLPLRLVIPGAKPAKANGCVFTDAQQRMFAHTPCSLRLSLGPSLVRIQYTYAKKNQTQSTRPNCDMMKDIIIKRREREKRAYILHSPAVLVFHVGASERGR